MGRTSGDAAAIGQSAEPSALESQEQLNQLLQAEANKLSVLGLPDALANANTTSSTTRQAEIAPEVRDRIILSRKTDDLVAAPSAVTERLWDVTAEGFSKIPDGFMHSLDPNLILPNVGMGFAIGGGTKLVLPKGGPVGKAAGVLVGLYFIGKPIVEGYGKAITAETMGDMHEASTILGDAVGGMPVALVEGAAGAAIGTKVVGRALNTSAAQPFNTWKANQWAKLDIGYDRANAATRNYAFSQFGIGSPVAPPMSGRAGIVPPYLLEQMAKTTGNIEILNTIPKTEALIRQGQFRTQLGQRALSQDFKGAREVYDAGGQETVGRRVRSEGEAKTGNLEVDNVYDYTGDVRSFYTDVHGRNSIDGRGMKMESTVNYGVDFENAFWDGSRMTYGRPGAKSPFKTFVLRDVTGHEITHGVTEFESGLVYRNQPGALNESHSDVFGALIVQKRLGQKASEASWLVGEGIWREGVNGRALRDMRKPGTAYNDPLLGKDPQTAHMNEYNPTRSDNGGVHINSGIPNRAFVEFSTSVGGYAWEIPGSIWYEARAKAGATPTFAEFAHHTIEAANRLGHSHVVPNLQKAWEAVGVKPSAKAIAETGGVPTLMFIGNPGDSGNKAG